MTAGELRARIEALMPQARQDLAELVSLESVADSSAFRRDQCRQAASRVAELASGAGLTDAACHETPDGTEAVIARAPAPDGAPTVLLYCHYDVQPALDDASWRTPPFELTERDGRWYGRGAADCKGNIVTHLTALRALGAGRFPVGVILVAEGSEEQGTGGLEEFVVDHPDLTRADAIVICDSGNVAAGVPTLTTSLRGMANVTVRVATSDRSLHSGAFGGAAPDALAALVRVLATLRDEHGNTTVRGLDSDQTWDGAPYQVERFRADAGVLDGVRMLGDGSVAEMIWARPAVTIVGIDCPSVDDSTPSILGTARARLNLRVPPGTDDAAAQRALVAHLKAVAPWGVRVEVDPEPSSPPLRLPAGGAAHAALVDALRESYGRDVVTSGQGGSIPLCNTLRRTYPDAEMAIIGVEEPGCAMHAANESVDPAEIEHLALAEALFLQRYAGAR